MIIRAVEIRDKATFIPALAILVADKNEAQRYLMQRCGFPVEMIAIALPSIVLMRLGDQRANSDPYSWSDRTHQVAHLHLLGLIAGSGSYADAKYVFRIRVPDGLVIDVEHILGETAEPKRSEREEYPI